MNPSIRDSIIRRKNVFNHAMRPSACDDLCMIGVFFSECGNVLGCESLGASPVRYFT